MHGCLGQWAGGRISTCLGVWVVVHAGGWVHEWVLASSTDSHEPGSVQFSEAEIVKWEPNTARLT